MVDAHFPLLVALLAALGLGGLILGLSSFLGPRRPSEVKSEAFECGNPSSGSALERFNVKFYLVAILFLVFDIEAVFIYPWALTFHEAAVSGGPVGTLLAELGAFVGIVVGGLAYVWRRGALDWNSPRAQVQGGGGRARPQEAA